MSNLKSKITNIIHLSTIALTLCQPALAKVTSGGGPGNGGDAVKLNGKWILLDLAEAGIEQSKDFNENLSDFYKYKIGNTTPVRGIIGSRLIDPAFTEELKDGLAAMLEYSGTNKTNLIAALELYHFELTNAPLRQIGDEQSTLDLDRMEVEQLAIRRDDRVVIYRPTFEKMDLLNQVALIVHELAYSLVIPVQGPGGDLYQESWRARSFVANQFGPSRSKQQIANAESRPGQFTFEGTGNIYLVSGVSSADINGDQFQIVSGLPHIIVSNQPIYLPELELPGRSRTGQIRVKDQSQPGWECKSNCVLLQGSDGPNGIEINSDPYKEIVCPYNSATYPLTNYYYTIPLNSVWRLEEYLTEQGPTLRPVLQKPIKELDMHESYKTTSKNRNECLANFGNYMKQLQTQENDEYQSFIRRVKNWK